MNNPLAWEIDLDDVHHVHECLKRRRQIICRPIYTVEELRNARDTLGRFVDTMAQNGMGAFFEDSYLRMFDALSFLTESLRGPQVKLDLFDRAIHELDALFSVPH